jgi:hypothetical protein
MSIMFLLRVEAVESAEVSIMRRRSGVGLVSI